MPYKQYAKIEGGKKLGSFITPMMATLTDEPAFDNPDWVFEIKWDGYRAVAELAGKDTRFYSRNGLAYDKAYTKIFDALTAIKKKAVIDGEVVVFNKEGKPEFQAIQNYKSNKKLPIQFQVFDCLQVDGKDITKKPLLQRKEILQEMLPESDVIKYCDHIVGEGKLLFEHAKKVEIEGIIGKRANSLYIPGKRSPDWLKFKNVLVDDFVIVGWIEPQGSREHIGAFMVAKDMEDGSLKYAGSVGTGKGWNAKKLKELYDQVAPLEQKNSPLKESVKEPGVKHWVKPQLVCQVQFVELTNDGHVRHNSFLGIRNDKVYGEEV
jgi:bifunctional non-homologous end joining protein LigD